MRALRVLVLLVLAFGLAACGGNGKFKTYNGPEVTSVQVHKDARKMYMLHHEKVLKTYDVALGFAPTGHKQFEGDGRTPEGTYTIDRRNPSSAFHLSIGISYPNQADRAYAEAFGNRPGGDIFIHGGPKMKVSRRGDRQRDGTHLCDGEGRNADPDPALTRWLTLWLTRWRWSRVRHL